MKLSNVRQIIAEDFPQESRPIVERLGGVLNYFMRQVVELNNGQIDFENTQWAVSNVEVTVDASGIPTQATRVLVNKNNPKGLSIIRSQNLTNSTIYPTNAPFMSYVAESNNVIRITHVTGLPANNKFRLTFISF
jgi:hypothetical protein